MHEANVLVVILAGLIAAEPPADGPRPPAAAGHEPILERVRVAPDGKRFVLEKSGRTFTPWGFNYDHDESERLIEDYWRDELAKVESDFAEMKRLGASVVRIHLQLARFLRGPDELDDANLERLGRLAELAARIGLYLDVTGLGCYRKSDVPAWYDAATEAERWKLQAAFWSAVASRLRDSPAVFCYDLMNEPVAPPGPRRPGDWLGPPFGKLHFVQFVTLDPNGREPPEIARQWISTLVRAIRRHDERRPITVGLVPWSLDRPGLRSGFVPEKIAPELDFLSVHIYPESGKLDEALDTVAGFAVGKPLVIEELFPLRCSSEELERFIDRSAASACGWIGFYWGQTIEECRRSGTIPGAITAQWLELFARRAAALPARVEVEDR